ncbi:hypothetical protein [Nitrososphaera sp.]|uniref:hypothetical protein n=1 Tax=Nitrososphaera sp. TaxID=1971748 RepID=UPI00307E9A58
MVISTSEHVLASDDNILAACLMDDKFNMVESAARDGFAQKFKITDDIEKSSSAWAAIMFGMAELTDSVFGKTRCVLVDHDFAKLLLLHVPPSGFVGLVLNRSANADYITLKVSTLLEPAEHDIARYA